MDKLQITLPEQAMYEAPLILEVGETILVGRKEDCQIRIPIVTISEHHCSISRDENGYIIRDLASTNGIVLNGQKHEELRLTPNLSFLLGNVSIIFREFAPVVTPPIADVVQAETPAIPAGMLAAPVVAMIPEQQQKIVYQNSTPKNEDAPSLQVITVPRHGLVSRIMMFIFAVIVLGSGVFVGLTIRHYMQTGEFLPISISGKESKIQQLKQEIEQKQQMLDQM